MWNYKFEKYLLKVGLKAIVKRLLTQIALIIFTTIEPTIAAEKINFNYGIANQSVSLEELETFANTGEISPSLATLFEFTEHNPRLIRLLLQQEISLDTVTVSDMLNSFVGEYILDRASNIVNSGASRGNTEALRGTLIASAKDDSKISLLEVWRNYPTKEIIVDGRSWSAMTKGFDNTLKKVGSVGLSIVLLRDFLNGQDSRIP